MNALDSEISTMLAALKKATDQHTAEYPTGQLPPPGRTYVNNALNAAATIPTLITSAYDRLETLRANDTLHPDGRKRMMDELLSDAEQKADEKVSQIEGNATVARATFITGAFPKMTKGQEMTAREDARMILDRDDNPIGTISRLALRQDDVGALVVTQWGQDYLRSRGCDDRDIKTAQAAIVGQALNGAAGQVADNDRAEAARGAMAAQSLTGIAGAAAQVAGRLLQSMREHYGIPRVATARPRDPRRPAAPTVLGEDIDTIGLTY
ncbi:hypothetical protein AB0H03_04315 [Streptomyces sparsogenes]|uniref:hypothetical protein n=1 Tax=Streptomyces sparsogenes TaxID=67365 RepID=UPI00340AEE63